MRMGIYPERHRRKNSLTTYLDKKSCCLRGPASHSESKNTVGSEMALAVAYMVRNAQKRELKE